MDWNQRTKGFAQSSFCFVAHNCITNCFAYGVADTAKVVRIFSLRWVEFVALRGGMGEENYELRDELTALVVDAFELGRFADWEDFQSTSWRDLDCQ